MGDKAMLTAQEAIGLCVAFPYARGRYQLPLGEIIVVNDLYGTPLYQLAERDLKPGQLAGVLATAAVIETMGADTKFVSDRTSMPTGGL